MKSKIISSSLLVVGFVIGATALSSFAAWSVPDTLDTAAGETGTCVPPKCNTKAPINIGSALQTKTGILSLLANGTGAYGLEVANGIKLIDGSVADGTANNKVLTSDASGVGTWQPATGGGGSCRWYQSSTERVPLATAVSNGATGICRGINNGVIKGSYLSGTPSGINTELSCAIVQGPAPMEYYGCTGGSNNGGASIPAGLVVGGNSDMSGNGGWGVWTTDGCPAAYRWIRAGDVDQGNGSVHICLTK